MRWTFQVGIQEGTKPLSTGFQARELTAWESRPAATRQRSSRASWKLQTPKALCSKVFTSRRIDFRTIDCVYKLTSI